MPETDEDVFNLYQNYNNENVALRRLYLGKNRTITEGNEKELEKISQEILKQYSDVMDSIGRTGDPFNSALKYFSPSGNLAGVDAPLIGKSYVFFTRPNCNFASPDNIYKIPLFEHAAKTKLGRNLMNLLQYVKNPGSGVINPIIGGKPYGDEKGMRINSPLIPLLTNCAINASGGSDLILNVHTTDGDKHGNKLSYAKSAAAALNIGTLTVQFRDLIHTPVLFLITLWVYYIHYYSLGHVIPDTEMLTNREIDYTCSIYIFLLDRSQKYIEKFTKFTGCFPLSAPFGQALHDQTIDPKLLQEISIPFQYTFQSHYEGPVLADFNTLMRPYITYLEPRRGGPLEYLKNPDDVEYPDSYVNDNEYRTDEEKEKKYKTRKFWKLNPFVYGNKLYFL